VDTIENLERKASGSLTLNLTVEGAQADVSRVLSEISGIKETDEIADSEENVSSFKLKLEDEKVRQEITSALVKNGLNIVEMSMERPDLEKVFLELTSKKAPKDNADNK
jgi:ABC-2 type transport system ATP-binding protein